MGAAKSRRELDLIGVEAANALADGWVSEADYTMLRTVQTWGEGQIKAKALAHDLQYGAPRKPVYDHGHARRCRTGRIALGLVPEAIARHLTPGELNVAITYAQDMISKGYTDDAKAFLAVRSKGCPRVAQRAQAVLVAHGMIKVTKRTMRGRRGYSTVVEIVDQTWLLWLRNRRVRPRVVGKGDWPVTEQVPRDYRRTFNRADSPQGARRWEKVARSVPNSTSTARRE